MNDPYIGILISSDGTVCRIGPDGFPVDSQPEPDEPPALDRPVIDADPVSVTDTEQRKELT